MSLARIDHLLLGCRSLDEGIAFVDARTSVRPALGGRHPSAGTHNALLSLGADRYLEVIAPEPGAGPLAEWARFLETASEPSLATWAAATNDLDALAERAREAGFGVRGPNPGSRSRPDGSTLAWRTLFVDAVLGLIMPFFIEWAAGTTHPSLDAPHGCTLQSFTIEHPDANAVRLVFDAIDLEAPVTDGPVERIVATLDTPVGRVTLD